MRYTVETNRGYLKAEMVERDTAEETREFVEAIVAAMHARKIPRVLISIRSSRALYKVDQWNLSGALERIMHLNGLRIAFIADSKELEMSQEYIALLGQQRGLAFRTFQGEKEAVEWLQEGAGEPAT